VTTPARANPEAAPAELTSEAILLRQFLFWSAVVAVGVAALNLVVWVIFHSFVSLGLLVLTVFVALPLLFYGYRLAGRNRVDTALLLASCMIWAFALITSATRGGSFLATAALFALWPVVLGVAYSSRGALLRVILISTAVCAAACGVNTYDDLTSSAQPASGARARRIARTLATTYVALISLSLWHSGSRLREILEETRKANRALAESERSLERKVEERTAELSDLNELARLVNATLDFDRVLATMSRALQKLFRFDQMGVFLLDADGARLRLDRMVGPSSTRLGSLEKTGIPMTEERSVSIRCGRRNVFAAMIGPEMVAALSRTTARSSNAIDAGLLICPLGSPTAYRHALHEHARALRAEPPRHRDHQR
jgi:hypothetical protein